MDEITRVVDALQLSARASVATPANWPNNHENIGAKGWAFLLPTVTPEVCTLVHCCFDLRLCSYTCESCARPTMRRHALPHRQ